MNIELVSRMENANIEEMAAYNKYIEMSNFAQEHGECKISKILKDMASEEKSHAEMLAYLLRKEIN